MRSKNSLKRCHPTAAAHGPPSASQPLLFAQYERSKTMGKVKELMMDQEDRKRKFSAICRIAKAVKANHDRVLPYLDNQNLSVSWSDLERELKGTDESVALEWMKAIWFEKTPPESDTFLKLWAIDIYLKEAILLALAEDAFANYLINDFFIYENPNVGQ
jgi:hypothetical protein